MKHVFYKGLLWDVEDECGPGSLRLGYPGPEGRETEWVSHDDPWWRPDMFRLSEAWCSVQGTLDEVQRQSHAPPCEAKLHDAIHRLRESLCAVESELFGREATP